MDRPYRQPHPVDHTPDGAPPRDGPRAEQFAHIPGWGVDRDKDVRPAVPMERMPPRLEGAPIPRPAPQRAEVEILHSTERPGITPLFGTSAPPRGVSGGMRRVAYRYAENDLRRWLMLLAADRVDVVEGLVSDLSHGQVPNVYREMGGRAELRHNPMGAARKVATIAVVVGIGWWLWQRRSPRLREWDD